MFAARCGRHTLWCLKPGLREIKASLGYIISWRPGGLQHHTLSQNETRLCRENVNYLYLYKYTALPLNSGPKAEAIIWYFVQLPMGHLKGLLAC